MDLNRKTVSYAFLNGILGVYADTFPNGRCSNQRIDTQMQHPNLRGPLLVNESNYNAAFSLAYALGAWVLNSEPLSLPDTVTQAWIQEQLSLVWLPFNWLLMGVCAGLLGLVGLRIWWRWRVNYDWKRRRQSFDT